MWEVSQSASRQWIRSMMSCPRKSHRRLLNLSHYVVDVSPLMYPWRRCSGTPVMPSPCWARWWVRASVAENQFCPYGSFSYHPPNIILISISISISSTFDCSLIFFISFNFYSISPTFTSFPCTLTSLLTSILIIIIIIKPCGFLGLLNRRCPLVGPLFVGRLIGGRGLGGRAPH